MAKTVIVLAALVALSSSATALGAGLVTGQDLHNWGKDSANPQERLTALGYVAGVMDLDTAAGIVCAPADSTLAQARAIVWKFTDDHPEYWNSNGAVVAGEALKRVWPCAALKPDA